MSDENSASDFFFFLCFRDLKSSSTWKSDAVRYKSSKTIKNLSHASRQILKPWVAAQIFPFRLGF